MNEHHDIPIEGRAVDGKERKAHGEKTGDQVSKLAKEVAERQGQIKAGQEKVTMTNGILLMKSCQGTVPQPSIKNKATWHTSCGYNSMSVVHVDLP